MPKRARFPLVVKNASRNVQLVSAGRVAGSYWTRLRGLLGTRPLQAGQGLLIVPGGRIHTHFMSYPIDVLYLDRALHVVGMDHSLPPWRLGGAYRDIRYVLELPAGALQASGTQVGDAIEIQGYRIEGR
jgi:uncharacterized membrane protein (UPF0127 family)